MIQLSGSVVWCPSELVFRIAAMSGLVVSKSSKSTGLLAGMIYRIGKVIAVCIQPVFILRVQARADFGEVAPVTVERVAAEALLQPQVVEQAFGEWVAHG